MSGRHLRPGSDFVTLVGREDIPKRVDRGLFCGVTVETVSRPVYESKGCFFY